MRAGPANQDIKDDTAPYGDEAMRGRLMDLQRFALLGRLSTILPA